MKRRVLASVLGLASLLLLVSATLAQGPEPPAPPERGLQDVGAPLEHQQWVEEPEPGAEVPRQRPRPLGAEAVEPAAVTLGEPGLSFRYVDTFGVTEEAYIEDSAHLAWPYGVGTDGANVWIADSWGIRAVKFANTGAFLMQIGTAGFRYGSGVSLDYVVDVAVDSSANIWVVDAGAGYVVEFDSGGDYVRELGVPWERGSDDSHFNDPISIAFDSAGNIYVSDTGMWGDDYGNHRIQIFDSSGSYLNTIGTTGSPGSGNNQFHSPRHIAIYGAYLYLADAGNHRVQIIDISNPASPSYFATLGMTDVPGSGNNQFDRPLGVAVDANYIYVADSNNNRVQVFNRTTRVYVASLGTGYGTGNYQFNGPADVAVDSAGNIYVADEGNARVQQFNSSRTYVRTYGTTGVPYLTDGYHYHLPSGVAAPQDGSIYLTEQRGHRLLKLNAAGVPQWTVGTPGACGELCGPEDVHLDSAGRVYVASAWNNLVQIYNSNGTYFTTLGTGWGSNNYQFDGANGVAIDSSGNIYVADQGNHRVQIYNSSRTYIARLGVTGVSGADNSHFDGPYDVAVDQAGNIYVVDHNNHRVQVFNSSRAYVRTIGETGVPGEDFGHFDNPVAVTIDAASRIYVADGWGDRVQVFDSTGAYLTTIGGWGSGSGQIRQARGLDVDNAGNLYIADSLNHRIQKFAPCVPGWLQVNINGFGDRWNDLVLSLATFNGNLYAGTANGEGGEVWRMGSEWEQVNGNGFGNSDNGGIDHLIEFDGYLYASTWNEADGGEVWRYNGTPWSQVASGGFGDSTNVEIYRFAVFDDTLYASTWSSTDTHGTEIYTTTNGTSWTRAVSNGFGDANNVAALSFEIFNGYLYAGTHNTTTGGEVWRSTNGASWSQVNLDGFGEAGNIAVSAVTAFRDWLYASTRHEPGAGAEVWRCQVCDGTDWTQVVDNGSGNTDTRGMSALEVFRDRVYLIVGNSTTGMEVWRTADGANWQQVGFAGFGDSNNRASYWDNSVAVTNDRLYIGTWNYANGGEIWTQQLSVYVPLVTKNY